MCARFPVIIVVDTGAMVSAPVPESGTGADGVSGSFESIERDAFMTPSEEALNVTMALHEPFGTTVEQLLVWLKIPNSRR